MLMVSLLSVHTPLLIVHTKLYSPGCRLLIVALFCVALLKAAVVGPAVCVHVPLPLVGVLPLSCSVSCKQTVLSDPAADGVTAWYTVTTAVSLYIAEQAPLCTVALYHVVAVKLLYGCMVVLLVMAVQLVPLSVLYSQPLIVPV